MEAFLGALQSATTGVAQAALAALGTPLVRQDDLLQHANGFVARIDLDCTAWGPAWLLLGALVAFGSLARVPLRRLLLSMALGVAMVVVVNQLRLVAVLWTGVHAPALLTAMHEGLGPLLLVFTGAAIVVAMAGRGAARTPPVRAHAAPQ